MYPTDTKIALVGLEEQLAMARIVRPQSVADVENSAPTDDLFEGINELLFSLLSRLPSGLELAMLQSLFHKIEQVKKSAILKSFPNEMTCRRRLKAGQKENARTVKNPIFFIFKTCEIMTAIAMKRRTVLIKITIFDDELDGICSVEVEALVMPNDDLMDYYNYRDSEPFVEICAIHGNLVPNEADSERLRNEILERHYELQQIEKEQLEDALDVARDMLFE